MASLDWSNSSLRRRSFRGKNLTGANFRGSDLRGCDFSQANLRGANFAQTRIGLAPESLAWGMILMFGTGAIAFHSLSILIFSILGIASEDPNYPLRLLCIAILALAGGLAGIAPRLRWSRPLTLIAAGLEGLLCSFFWGGVLSDLNTSVATLCGIVGMLGLILGVQFAPRLGVGVIVSTLGTLFANAMCFVAGVNSLNAGFIGRWGIAVIWGLVALLYLRFTLQTIGQVYRELKQMAWTSFDQAELTDARWTL